MTSSLTPSEKFVAGPCERTLLHLWAHPNPKGKKDEELCGCLVAYGPYVMIISIKDNEYRETGDKTGWKRWTKVTIDKSIAQMWGAERWLGTMETAERTDGRTVAFPPKNQRRYRHIAVAPGSRGEIPLTWGDSDTGFVHVCGEFNVDALFLALDTITDFVELLRATEKLVAGGVRPPFSRGDLEDLVAFYLLHGCSFNLDSRKQNRTDVTLILYNGIRKGVVESNEFKRIRKDLENSYVWDHLINLYTRDLLTGGMFDMYSQQTTDNELALVAMAIQPRVHRSFLAGAFLQFLNSGALKSAVKVAQGYADTASVFTTGSNSDRGQRSKELFLRYLVVRGRMPGVRTVVGIATDHPGTSSIGYSSDIVHICLKEWSDKQAADVDGIQRDLGYFQNVSQTER